MPVHKEGSGYQFGNHGKVYPDKADAVKQMQAAYANGWNGKKEGGEVDNDTQELHKKVMQACLDHYKSGDARDLMNAVMDKKEKKDETPPADEDASMDSDSDDAIAALAKKYRPKDE